MPMEGWVNCLSPQNTFGVLRVNSVAAEFNKFEDIGDLSLYVIKKQKNITCICTACAMSSKCP